MKACQYPDGMTEEEAAALDENSYLDLLGNSRIVYASLELSTGEKTQVYSQTSGGNSPAEASWTDVCMPLMSQARTL